MIRFFKDYYFAFIIPSIVLVSSYLLRLAAGPYWLCMNFDPSYQYLVNGLYIVKGIAPGHTDHPGTPLQILCFLVIWLFNIGRHVPEVVKNVLIAPEFYLNAVNFLLITFTFLTSVGLAIYTYQKSQNKILAFLTQLPALSFLVLKSFDSNNAIIPVVANVFPETMLIAIINLYNLAFLSLFFANSLQDEIKSIIYLGFIAGLGVATKITFIPLLMIVLIVLPWKRKGLFILLFFASFILWTLPISSRYPLLWKWIVSLTTHTGIYGRGSSGFIEFNTYLKSWRDIFFQEGFYVVLAILGLMIGVFKNFRKKANKDTIFLLAIAVGILIEFALVAKHPSQHYLLPGIAESGLLLVFIYFNLSSLYKHLNSVMMIFILTFVLFSTAQAFAYREKLSAFTKDIYSFHELIRNKYQGALFLGYYRSSGKESALNFGNAWRINDEGVQQELTELYPNTYFFDVFGSQFANFKERVWLDDIAAKSPEIIFQGTPFDFTGLPFQVRLVDKGSQENVYILTATSEKQANQLFAAAQLYFQQKDYSKALYLGLLAKKMNYCPTRAVDNFVQVMAFLTQQGSK